MAIVYWILDKKKGLQLAYSLIFSVAFSCGIKGVFKVPRPYNYEGIIVKNKHTAPGFSFPSADSTAAASVAGSFMSWTKNNIFRILFVIYMILIAFSRMYFGLHFPTDVVAGLTIGILISFIISKLLNSHLNMNVCYIASTLILLIFIPFGQEPDFYKTLGLMLGSVAGLLIEQQVNFTTIISKQKKVLRLTVGLLGIIIIAVLSSIFMPENNICYCIEKFLLTFFAVGIYPLIFTKFNF
ncbi:MAG: phosphatase PAP2 family protein [Clostridia bacterium]|nr:phosphatase PAP2 family protein [Clostridia bacterium]